MNTRISFFISYLLCCKLVFSTDFQDEEESEHYNYISDSCNNFSSKFIQTLTLNHNQENILTSSLSAYIVLSVLFHGADKVTKEELKHNLYLFDSKQLQNGFKQLSKSFNNIEKAELEIANAMFVSTNFSLKKDFLTKSKDVYETTVGIIDPQDSISSTNKINLWIKDKTKGKIIDIVRFSDIDEYTKLILINALYFKSAWLKPFDPQVTEKKKFHSIDGVETYIPTMYKTIQLPHGNIPSLDAKFIKLKYKNEDFELFIILPNKKHGLYYLERNFNWNLVSKAPYSTKEIDLVLPKFKLETTIDLKETLQKLGIKTIFEETANFSFMAKEPVYVGKIIQKLFVEVDEKGSEAAAATVAEIRSRRMVVDNDYFIVDHPFMFIINHRPSNIPLFFGSIRKLGEVKDEL